jgi:hypothetical protein
MEGPKMSPHNDGLGHLKIMNKMEIGKTIHPIFEQVNKGNPKNPWQETISFIFSSKQLHGRSGAKLTIRKE